MKRTGKNKRRLVPSSDPLDSPGTGSTTGPSSLSAPTSTPSSRLIAGVLSTPSLPHSNNGRGKILGSAENQSVRVTYLPNLSFNENIYEKLVLIKTIALCCSFLKENSLSRQMPTHMVTFVISTSQVIQICVHTSLIF